MHTPDGWDHVGVPLRDSDPRQVGSYPLLRRLGDGGMGVVYLGFGDRERPVAVKVIRPEVAGVAEFRARFRRETASARRVRGFCTAEVLDADPDGDPAYLVTDYVPGPTLTDAVADRGPLSPTELEQLAVNMATALTVIHRAGVIHRDLKPSNVLLSPTGARVIDFGIARAMDATTALSRDLQRLGTPAFMAPEQVRGIVLTPAVDIFAWGGLVTYAGTGSLPFGDGPIELLPYRILTEEPRLDGLAGNLRDVVARAMRKDPAERPSGTELYNLLLDDPSVTVVVPPPTTPPAPVTPPDTAVPTAPAAPVAPAAPTDSGMGAQPAPQAASRIAGSGAESRRSWRRPRRAVLALTAGLAVLIAVTTTVLLSRGDSGSGGSAAGGAGSLPVLASLATITGHADYLNRVAFSPDGTTLATTSADHTARLWDVTVARAPRQLAVLRGHTRKVVGVAFSPDGTTLATTGDDFTARLWDLSDLESPRTFAILADHTSLVHGVAFSPDGRTLGTASRDGTARLWDVAAIRTRMAQIDPSRPGVVAPIATITGHSGLVNDVAFSADGATLATAGYDGTVRLWSLAALDQPQPVGTLTGFDGPVNTLAFDPDPGILATVDADYSVRLWDVANPSKPDRLAHLPGSYSSVAFNSNGTVLATTSPPNLRNSGADEKRDGQLWDVTGGRPREVAVIPGAAGSITFNRDGRIVAAAGGNDDARLWAVPDGLVHGG